MTPVRHTLDARGMVCPEPIREAEQAIRRLAPGSRLKVLATDPAAPIDFEAWCFHRGHEYQGVSEVNAWLEIVVVKGSARNPG